MRLISIVSLAGLLLAGCSSSDNLPLGVQAAFVAEHPYSTIDDFKKQNDEQGNDQYLVNYSHFDGTKAVALYGSSGEAQSY
jgi:uncharacterized protein YcfL